MDRKFDRDDKRYLTVKEEIELLKALNEDDIVSNDEEFEALTHPFDY